MTMRKTGSFWSRCGSRQHEALWPAERRDAERRNQRRAMARGIAALVVLAVLVWGIG